MVTKLSLRTDSKMTRCIFSPAPIEMAPRAWMPKLFLVITTIVLTLITTAQAFQITKLFQTPPKLKVPNMSNEQTFIAVKPDGVMRGLVGEIIGRFEKRGYVNLEREGSLQ
jgi:Nucleoside diphosphate kinase